jgi:hypothetical protein
MNIVSLVVSKIWWFLCSALSSNAAISFGRFMSLAWSVYFMVLDAWLYHRTGHMVDNLTLGTQLGVITTFYGVTKVKEASGSSEKPPEV